MVWATPSMLLTSYHSQVKTLQSRGRLLFKGERMIWPRYQARCYNLQIKLHQLKSHLHRHQPKSLMDRLHVVEQRSYNKRWTRYFVRIILTSMRIIYCLSRVHCYCLGSPRRMAGTYKEMTTEKDHTRTRPVQQNSSKETVITLDFQRLWRSMRTFWKAY